MSYIRKIDEQIEIERSGVTEVLVDAIQNITADGAAWGFRLYVNGSLIIDTGRRVCRQELVHLSGFARFNNISGPTPISIQVDWAGDSSITLTQMSVSVKHFNGSTY